MCGVEGVRRLLKFGPTSGASLHDLVFSSYRRILVGCPRLPTAMQPCFAVRFHRGGKLFISHGVSLWAIKLAVLLRLHHSRHSRQLASCVWDLPCWVEVI